MTDLEQAARRALDALEHHTEQTRPIQRTKEAIASLRAALEQAEPVVDAVRGECRLWDSQWTNIVNHANCYADWSKEDAIHYAVKMTETYLARNVTRNHFPPAQQAEPVAMSASGTKEAAFIGGKLYHIDPRQAQWIEDRLGVVQAEPVDKALTKPAPQVDKEQAEPVVEPHKPATSPDNGQFMSHDGNASC